MRELYTVIAHLRDGLKRSVKIGIELLLDRKKQYAHRDTLFATCPESQERGRTKGDEFAPGKVIPASTLSLAYQNNGAQDMGDGNPSAV